MEPKFFWSVEKFKGFPVKPGESLLSPIFYAESSKAAEFCLRLQGVGFPFGDKFRSANLFLCRCDKYGPENVEVEYTLSFDYKYRISKYKRKFPKPQLDDLYTSDESDAFPVTMGDYEGLDEIMVVCTITSYDDDSSDMYAKQDLHELSRDINEMFNSALFSDAVIRIQNQEFDIHKAILEVRCPGLLKECQVKVRQKRTPECDDCDIHMLLHYIYNGRFECKDIPDDLYFLLKKYKDSIFKQLFTPFPASMYVHTSFKVNEICIHWDIENFLRCKEDKEHCLKITEGDPSTWYKITLFTFQNGGKTEQLRFVMDKMCENSLPFVLCRIKVYGANPEGITIFDKGHLFIDEHAWDEQIDTALNTIRRKQRGRTTRFTIEVCLTDGIPIHSVKKVHISSFFDAPQMREKLYLLGHDMRKLYKNPMHSDVTLVIKNERFPAHKAILSARSPHFLKMFKQNDKIESVQICFDEEVALIMICYIYCAQLPKLDVDLAFDVYRAADFYQICQLKKKCSEFLKSSLTEANVVKILFFADTQNHDELKRSAYNIITSNPSCVFESKESMGIMRSYHYLKLELMKEIYKYTAENQ